LPKTLVPSVFEAAFSRLRIYKDFAFVLYLSTGQISAQYIYYSLAEKNHMPKRQKGRMQNIPSKHLFKKALVHSGYSEAVTDKVWEYYNH
jgi:hypothetical protein